jgi:hypothetical protein
VEYAYAYEIKSAQKACLILRVPDAAVAVDVLSKTDLTLVDSIEL